jgi:hypothetical protein
MRASWGVRAGRLAVDAYVKVRSEKKTFAVHENPTKHSSAQHAGPIPEIC